VLAALVLTAGLGTRLDPLTRLLAKPAVPIAGRTLVERALSWLSSQGVTDVVLNLHHRPETITSIVGDGTRLGLRVRYSWESLILGSAGGPRHALPLLDTDPFLIVNGDTLCDVDLPSMIDAHRNSQAAVTLAVVPNPAPEHYNGIVLDDERRVTSFVPKGSGDATWHFVGIQVANASVFAELPDMVPAETVAGIYRDRLTAESGTVRGWPVTARFVDVGTPRDYLRTVLEMAPNGRVQASGTATPGGPTAVIEGNRSLVDAAATLIGSVVWPDVQIGSKVLLEECVVTSGVRVPEGFRSGRSVLVPVSVVRRGENDEKVGNFAVFPMETS